MPCAGALAWTPIPGGPSVGSLPPTTTLRQEDVLEQFLAACRMPRGLPAPAVGPPDRGRMPQLDAFGLWRR